MDAEVSVVLDRAEELLRQLEEEYLACLSARSVSRRAGSLTHEVLERLRNALDQAMFRVWERHAASAIPQERRDRAKVYFPISRDLRGFRSALDRALMGDLEQTQPALYKFLLSKQPFESVENSWLRALAQLAAVGKHVRLLPQVKHEQRRVPAREGERVEVWVSFVIEGYNVNALRLCRDAISKTQRLAVELLVFARHTSGTRHGGLPSALL